MGRVTQRATRNHGCSLEKHAQQDARWRRRDRAHVSGSNVVVNAETAGAQSAEAKVALARTTDKAERDARVKLPALCRRRRLGDLGVVVDNGREGVA